MYMSGPFHWQWWINRCYWKNWREVCLPLYCVLGPSAIELTFWSILISLELSIHCCLHGYFFVSSYVMFTWFQKFSFSRSWERNGSFWKYMCGGYCSWNSRVPYHIWGTSMSVWSGMFFIGSLIQHLISTQIFQYFQWTYPKFEFLIWL